MHAQPPSDSCERALKQLTALILNVCSDRLQDSWGVGPGGGCTSTNVGDLIDEIAALIQNGDCTTANDCAAAVNESGTETLSVLPKTGVKKEANRRGK